MWDHITLSREQASWAEEQGKKIRLSQDDDRLSEAKAKLKESLKEIEFTIENSVCSLGGLSLAKEALDAVEEKLRLITAAEAWAVLQAMRNKVQFPVGAPQTLPSTLEGGGVDKDDPSGVIWEFGDGWSFTVYWSIGTSGQHCQNLLWVSPTCSYYLSLDGRKAYDDQTATLAEESGDGWPSQESPLLTKFKSLITSMDDKRLMELLHDLTDKHPEQWSKLQEANPELALDVQRLLDK